MTRQLIRVGTAIMTTLLALAVLWQLRIVLVYVLISLTLAATLRPAAKYLVRQSGLARPAWTMVYFLALGAFGFLIYQGGKAVAEEMQQLTTVVSTQEVWKLPLWLEGTPFRQGLVFQLPPNKLFESIIGEQGQFVFPVMLGFTQRIAGFLSSVLIVTFMCIYWTLNQSHFERLWLSLLPTDQRKVARDVWRTIEPELGAYIRSELIQIILAALMLGIGYQLLGAPYPVLLALGGALAWLIPVLGGALALVPPLLVGLLTGAQVSMIAFLYTLVILMTLQLWVEPHLFNRKWSNPILTLTIIVIMANAFGLPGILLAPPISVVCQILWHSLMVREPLTARPAIQISDLRQRQEKIRESLSEVDETSLMLVTSHMERLTLLIDKAEPVLHSGAESESPNGHAPTAPQPVPVNQSSSTSKKP